MSSAPVVYILDPYHSAAIELLQSTDWIDVRLHDDPRKTSWYNDADAVIIRSDTRLAEADFGMAARLKLIVKQGVGVDNIDLDAARNAGIAVHNTPALNSESVAELTLAMTLSVARRIPELDRRLRSGQRIVRSQTLGMSLFGKSVGVIGMGNIGKIVAQKFRSACEASILAYDPVAPADIWQDLPLTRLTDLHHLLRDSDVVTLHVPLLKGTRGMIGADELDIMKENAILVNAARGEIVDEKALLATLQSGRLWGAVLDAMKIEPPTKEAYSGFLELDNVVITPHVGASTMENQRNSGLAVVRTLLAALRGEQDVPGKVV